MLLTVGCSKGVNDEVAGDWAYIHDPETIVLSIGKDGKAAFDGIDYKASADDRFITLSDENGEKTEHRYRVDSTGNLFFYETAVYTFDGEGEPEGLIGVWNDSETNWSFEFTDKGTFKEDGYFPGTYVVNDEAGTIRLTYNDMFTDTICYYSISGNKMTIEYPWEMVKVTK